jgi:carboxypeptidase Q
MIANFVCGIPPNLLYLGEMRTLTATLFCLCASVLWSQVNPASSSPSMFVRLSAVGDAASKTDAYPDIEKLSNQIGPRLTGSTAVRKGAQYVLERMREIGLSHVHTEGWGLTRGWQRGPATASLVSPFSLPIQTAAYGWSGSTPNQSGPARVVLLNADDVAERLLMLVQSQGASWNQKILLVSANASVPMRTYAELLPLVRAASAAHAIAVLRHDTRPGAGIVHAEPLSAVLPTRVDPTLIPALDIPSESEELLEHLLRSGQTVKMRISVENTFSPGSITSNNIVGEIEGAVYPEQIVLVGAHLDSWDLGTGATDDGFGVATVLGVAQTLIRSKLHPSRTMRFVLFTGEEQGLLGSTAYVHAHANELSRIVAAFALDWGAGRIVKLPVAGHVELLPLLQQLNQLAPELRLEPPTDGWMFMTDAYAFTLAGVPGIAPLVQSSGYYEQAHSLEDTLDKVNRSDLQQATTVLALASFLLADSPSIPSTRFTDQQTRSSLIQGNQRQVLEALGLWPFTE